MYILNPLVLYPGHARQQTKDCRRLARIARSGKHAGHSFPRAITRSSRQKGRRLVRQRVGRELALLHIFKRQKAASADDSSQELSPPPKKLSRSKSPVPVTFHPKTPANTAGSGIDGEASTGNRRVHALPACGLVYT